MAESLELRFLFSITDYLVSQVSMLIKRRQTNW